MGLGTAMKLMRDNVLSFPGAPKGQSGILSPWAEGQLQQVVWSDIFGVESAVPTRREAMTLPAVVKGRGLIVEALAGRRLVATKNGVPLAQQPSWLYRTNTSVPPWFRMAHTIDDLIFYGQSLWTVERGSEGQITDAMRIPYDRWDTNDDYEILVDDRPVSARDVIYFQGPFEGLLVSAGRTIQSAIALEQTWANRAGTPLPSIILEQKEQDNLSDEEIAQHVSDVAAARRNKNGAVMFVPYQLNARVEGDNSPDLLIEARNAVKLDVANFLNLPTSALDAALPKASLNYETTQGKEAALGNRMPYWSEPLEARLSMDDVCNRGQSISFDLSDTPQPDDAETGPFKED